MARPSQAVDQALIASALALYPQCGCAGLSLRKVAEHAGTQPAMVHYHFGGKPAFLRAVLQQLYEQMFTALDGQGRGEGRPVARLRGALLTLAGFLRQHRAVVGRLALDAAGRAGGAGIPARQRPAPPGPAAGPAARGPGGGRTAALPPLQAFTFLMGAVNAPTLIATGAQQLGLAPALLGPALAEQVLGEAALVQRVDLALSALGRPIPAQECPHEAHPLPVRAAPSPARPAAAGGRAGRLPALGPGRLVRLCGGRLRLRGRPGGRHPDPPGRGRGPDGGRQRAAVPAGRRERPRRPRPGRGPGGGRPGPGQQRPDRAAPPQLAVSRAQLAQARAAATLADAELLRQRSLVAQGFISQSQLDNAATAARQAHDKVAELEAALQTAEQPTARPAELAAAQANTRAAQEAQAQAAWREQQARQSAPAAGLVADTFFREGEYVGAGQPVVSLLPPDHRKARFYVPEAEVGRLQVGQPVSLGCDGCGAPIAARISRIAPQAEYTPPVIYSNSQRSKLVFQVEALPAPADALKLHPGQPLDVRPWPARAAEPAMAASAPTPAPDWAIDVRGLTKRYGATTVVDHVDLQLRPGRICGFLGPNGSGKTTTIRMLCGLLTPDEGEGHCLGLDLRRDALEIRRQVGYMTQRFGLYEDLSIRENLDFIARLFELPERKRQVDEALERLGLVSRQRQLAGALGRLEAAPGPGGLPAAPAAPAAAGRAHRGCGPEGPARLLGRDPPPGGRGHHGAGLHPLHGRGRALP
jgi:AcrR family transcriptional regulator/biotin carboxyl carrier protein